MSERFKGALPGSWLLVSSVCLLLPVFLPSNSFSINPAANIIGTATATMFILSFPSGLIGLPQMVFVNYALGIAPGSIQGMYINLVLLFVLGLLQWFWIVPRVWRNPPVVQTLELQNVERNEIPACKPFKVLDSRERTPIERVINADEE